MARTSVVPSVRDSVRVTEAPASVTGTEATEVREPKTREKKDLFFFSSVQQGAKEWRVMGDRTKNTCAPTQLKWWSTRWVSGNNTATIFQHSPGSRVVS